MEMTLLKSKAILALVGEYLRGIELDPLLLQSADTTKVREWRSEASAIVSMGIFGKLIDSQIDQYQQMIFKAEDVEMNAARILALKTFRDEMQNLAKPMTYANKNKEKE